jgi:hypothetical protein
MRIATIELEKKAPESAMLSSSNNREEIIAKEINVEFKSQHVIFYITYIINSRVTEEIIAYRASDVISVVIRNE